MTAPELQRMITREVIERQAVERHRQIARQVLAAGGRIAVIHGRNQVRAAIWPTARSGLLVVDQEALAISWAEWAINQGWLSETGHQHVMSDGAVWRAYVLTPAGRRFADELGRADLMPPLPGDRRPRRR